MENKEFERFSKAWSANNSKSSSQKVYSEKEITDIKMKNSLDFSRSINKSIVFDYVLKSILIAGMLLLIWVFKSEIPLLLILIGLIGFSVFLLNREANIRAELLKLENYSKELSVILKSKIRFYGVHFPALKLMLAFTNSLLVWVGSMFYFYAKYGYYRIDDIIDVLVTFLIVSLAFGISYFALSYQFKLSILDLEESLMNLDDLDAASINIHEQQRRKKKFNKVLTIAIIAGLVLLLFFLLSYLKFN